MPEPVIEREDVVGLLFAVYDISETLRAVEALPKEDADGEEEAE